MSGCKNSNVPSTRACYVFPIGSKNILFRRISNRYGRKGTFSNNQGYKRVKRDILTGKFVPIG